MSDELFAEPLRGELFRHFAAIVDKGLSATEWAERESSDMFQSDHFSGGFDATEGEFLFSYYPKEGGEFWFGLSLAEVETAVETDSLPALRIRAADQ
jgi:hypothetical protein